MRWLVLMLIGCGGALPVPQEMSSAEFVFENRCAEPVMCRIYREAGPFDPYDGAYGGHMPPGASATDVSCRVGETVCFGAWSPSHTWGRGRGDGACPDCCTTCGSTQETWATLCE